MTKNRLTMASLDISKKQVYRMTIKKDFDSLVFVFNFFNTSVPDAEVLEYRHRYSLIFRKTVFKINKGNVSNGD
jgi:hypothetical protein